MYLNEKSIGDRIKIDREKNKMSQRELSEKTSISISQISNYENGKILPNLFSAAIICESLNISLDWLCFGKESDRLISTSQTKGEIITNCFVELIKQDVLDYKNYIQILKMKDIILL